MERLDDYADEYSSAQGQPQVRLPTEKDVRTIFGYRALQPGTLLYSPEAEQVFCWYLQKDRSRSHQSFSRVIQSDEVICHISANLVPEAVADEVFSNQDFSFLADPSRLVPLTDEDLRASNEEPHFPTLVVTNFSYVPLCIHSSPSAQQFEAIQLAIHHLSRWFVGNSIGSILLAVPNDWLLFRLLYKDVSPLFLRATTVSDSMSLVRINKNNCGIEFHQKWYLRLLDCYLPPDVSLSDNLKGHGRVLYEFDFDLFAAVSGCIPSWTVRRARNKVECAGYNKWRTAAAIDLGINWDGDKRAAVSKAIRDVISREPQILRLQLS